MENRKEPSPVERILVPIGAILGLAAACVAIFVVPITGILPGALVGMGGPVLGIAIARGIAALVTRSQR